MSFEVRAAQAEEAEAIVRLYEWLFAPPGSRPEAWDERRAVVALRQAIASHDSAVLVAARDDGALIGFVTGYQDMHSVRFGYRVWVEDLAVDPEERSKGSARRCWTRPSPGRASAAPPISSSTAPCHVPTPTASTTARAPSTGRSVSAGRFELRRHLRLKPRLRGPEPADDLPAQLRHHPRRGVRVELGDLAATVPSIPARSASRPLATSFIVARQSTLHSSFARPPRLISRPTDFGSRTFSFRSLRSEPGGAGPPADPPSPENRAVRVPVELAVNACAAASPSDHDENR